MTDMKTPRISLLLLLRQVESFKFMKHNVNIGGECVFTTNSFYGTQSKKQSDVPFLKV